MTQIPDSDLPAFTGFAYVGVSNPVKKLSHNELLEFYIDWESVRPTLEAAKVYADEWHEPGLIVELQVTAKIVHADIERNAGRPGKPDHGHPLFASP